MAVATASKGLEEHRVTAVERNLESSAAVAVGSRVPLAGRLGVTDDGRIPIKTEQARLSRRYSGGRGDF